MCDEVEIITTNRREWQQIFWHKHSPSSKAHFICSILIIRWHARINVRYAHILRTYNSIGRYSWEALWPRSDKHTIAMKIRLVESFVSVHNKNVINKQNDEMNNFNAASCAVLFIIYSMPFSLFFSIHLHVSVVTFLCHCAQENQLVKFTHDNCLRRKSFFFHIWVWKCKKKDWKSKKRERFF